MDLYHHLRHLTLTRRLVISLVVAVIVGFYTLPSGPSLEASSVRCTTPRNDILSPGLLLLNLSHPFKTHYSPLFFSQAAFSDSDSLPEAKANPNLLLSLYLDWRSQSGIQRTKGWDWEGGPEDVEGVSVEMEEMVGSLGEEVDGIFSEERVRESLGWVRGSIIREGEEEGDGMESEGWIWPDGMGEEALYSPPLPESSVLSPHNLSPLRIRTILYLSTTHYSALLPLVLCIFIRRGWRRDDSLRASPLQTPPTLPPSSHPPTRAPISTPPRNRRGSPSSHTTFRTPRVGERVSENHTGRNRPLRFRRRLGSVAGREAATAAVGIGLGGGRCKEDVEFFFFGRGGGRGRRGRRGRMGTRRSLA
ncbi:hypothetical protein BT69DRAFT_451774 [Atractiella rhizophila]|nr:hypothetical protein BT69DRAFT_451774 [Atractiella rhizophila]